MNTPVSLHRGFLIIHELVQCGITDFFIAPGSRSTPLAIATSQVKGAIQHVFYDERSLGFTALGTAKATRKPVVVITTSGTAVANLVPSVVEAFYDNVPLILLTCDRPFELQDTGANQSISQKRLFSEYVEWSISLSCSDEHVLDHVFLSTIDMAVYRSLQSKKPIQLNCEFREPFSIYTPVSMASKPYCVFNRLPSLPVFEAGVILAGDMTDAESEAVLLLAESLGWVIVPDCMSPLRFKEHPLIRPEYSFIKTVTTSICVIQVGKRCLESLFISALRKSTSFWIMVTASLPLNNPNHLCQAAFVGSIVENCLRLSDELPSTFDSFYEDVTIEFPVNRLHEASLFSLIPPQLCEDRFLFLSNSRVVRSFNLCAPRHKIGPVFVNRGASGIDGIISTAIGVSKGLKKSGILFIGDLSFCYDLNALGHLDSSIKPLTIFVLNNGGGGIFRSLPVYNSISKETFTQLFQTPHGAVSFELIAKHYGCEYRNVQSVDDLTSVYSECFSKHALIEIVYDIDENEAVFMRV